MPIQRADRTANSATGRGFRYFTTLGWMIHPYKPFEEGILLSLMT